MKYDLTHLDDYSDSSCGPIQQDEALFLYALVKMVRPRIVVEFGFYMGHSARNFLQALPSDSRLYSYDNSKEAEQLARLIKDCRFKFILKNQADFTPLDIGNNLIDFVFIDASHNLVSNIKTFEKIKNSLSKNCIIAIHDTGTWNVEFQQRDSKGNILLSPMGYFLNEKEYIPLPDERRFVNYLRKYHPQFHQINLHSLATLRHGITILQKNDFLSLGPMTLSQRFETYLKMHQLWKIWSFLWILQKILIAIERKKIPSRKEILEHYLKKRRNEGKV